MYTQQPYTIRRWNEQLCRKGQDNPLIECGLVDSALVLVDYHTEDDGEDGIAICLDRVVPPKTIILDGGTGPFLTYRGGEDCLEFLPDAIQQEIRENIEIPKPEFDFAVEL